jgi:hypothetical protein
MRRFLVLFAMICASFAASAQTIYIHSFSESKDFNGYAAVSIQKMHLPYTLVDDEKKADYILFVDNLDHVKRGNNAVLKVQHIGGAGVVSPIETAQTTLYDNHKQASVWGRAIHIHSNMQQDSDEIFKHLAKFLKKK